MPDLQHNNPKTSELCLLVLLFCTKIKNLTYILIGDYMLSLKTNFLVISIRKYFITFLCLMFTISLILFSETNLESAKSGLLLWSNSVVPSLFPFFVATEILCNTNLIYLAGKYLKNFVKKIFNVPGEGAIALILGIISGYPTGAKVIVNLKENGILSKEEAERLISFTNNSGPLFILGTIGVSFLNNKTLGYILLFTHILACLTVGIIFRNWKKNKNVNFKTHDIYVQNKTITFSNLGEILGSSIKKSVLTILNIGGFIVIFSVIISILENSKIFIFINNFCNRMGLPGDIVIGIFKGILELTNGAKIISGFGIKCMPLLAFLIGFGGISVLLQVYSIIVKENISIKPYIYGKILQGIFASLYTSIILVILQIL